MAKVKFCDVGSHEVIALFHARRKDRPSCCQACLKRKPILSSKTQSNSSPNTLHTKGEIVKHRGDNEVRNPKDKTIPELLKLATIVFNKWVRNRDKWLDLFRCISCNEFKSVTVMQAGHFQSSTSSSLRFNENNVNGECETCNCHDPNHLIGYRKNLIKKIGLDAVIELESTPIAKYHKWERTELLEIISRYKL